MGLYREILQVHVFFQLWFGRESLESSLVAVKGFEYAEGRGC